MKISSIPFLGLLLALFIAIPAQAQQTPGADISAGETESRLDVLVASHESVSDRQRNEVAAFLMRADVQEVARNRGFEIERVQAAAAGLSNAQVAEVATALTALAPVQEGRGLGSITISVAAVIIILLVLILVT